MDLGLQQRVTVSHAANAAAAVMLDVPPSAAAALAGGSGTLAFGRSPSPAATRAASAAKTAGATVSALSSVVAGAAVHAEAAAAATNGYVGAAVAAAAAAGKLPRIPSPGTYTAEAAGGAGQATRAPTSAALAAAALAAVRRTTRPMSALHNDLGDFIQEVGDDERFANEGTALSRPISAYPVPRTKSQAASQAAAQGAAAGSGRVAAVQAQGSNKKPASRPGQRAGLASAALRPWTSKQAGMVETVSETATAGAMQHLRAASAALRKYAVPPNPSAISGVATTYARKPRAPYNNDINTPTPSERIANNMSPLARGLSPRTLEILSPGGISPTALGSLPHPTWQVGYCMGNGIRLPVLSPTFCGYAMCLHSAYHAVW